MKILALALPLVFATAAWADDDEKPLPTKMQLSQDTEQERHRPEAENIAGPGPVMDYIFQHSRLETGVLLTHFDNDLKLESEIGFYARYSVEVLPHVAVNVTYRHYDFENSDAPVGHASADIRGLIAGAMFRMPLTEDFGFEAGGGIGFQSYHTGAAGFSDDTGMVLSGEAAMTVWLTAALRLRAGVGLDTVYTDLHQSSTDSSVNLMWLLGIQIGGL